MLRHPVPSRIRFAANDSARVREPAARGQRHREPRPGEPEPRVLPQGRLARSFRGLQPLARESDPRPGPQGLAREMPLAGCRFLQRGSARGQRTGRSAQGEQLQRGSLGQHRELRVHALHQGDPSRRAAARLHPLSDDLQAARFEHHLAQDHVGGSERSRELARVRRQRGIVQPQVAPPQHRVELLEREEVVPVRLDHRVEDGFRHRHPRSPGRLGARREGKDEDGFGGEQSGEQDAHASKLPRGPEPG